MPEKNSHIDELFRKKLSDHELSPPPELWNKINSDLSARRKSIAYYLVRIAAGGLILLGLGGGLMYWFTQDNNWDNYLSPATTVTPPADEPGTVQVPRPAPLTPDIIDNAATGSESEILSGQTTSENGFALSSDREPSEKPDTELQQPARQSDQNLAALKPERSVPGNQIIPEYTGDHSQRQPGQSQIRSSNNSEIPLQLAFLIPEPVKELTVTDMKTVGLAHWLAMASMEQEPEIALQEDKTQSGRWSAMVMVAPNYSYRTLSAGASGSYSKEQFNNFEAGLFSFSGSINIIYRINDRLALQSGLDLVRMGQKIYNVQIFDDPQVLEKLNSTGLADYYRSTPSVSNSFGDIQTSASNIYFTDNHNRELNQMVNPQSRFELSSTGFQYASGNELKQGLYYIQTPVMLRYSLLTGNTGLVISGGLGANFLAGNNVFLKYDGENINIGRTSNINNFGLSGIVAIGIERRLSGKIKLLLEPRFNHFISRINSTGSIRSLPYSFSVSGGISFGF